MCKKRMGRGFRFLGEGCLVDFNFERNIKGRGLWVGVLVREERRWFVRSGSKGAFGVGVVGWV